jgi:hypothetical protein
MTKFELEDKFTMQPYRAYAAASTQYYDRVFSGLLDTQDVEVSWGNFEVVLPQGISHLKKCEEHFRVIKSLNRNWDDNEALPIPEEVISAAFVFLFAYALFVWDSYDCALDEPSISPLPNKSIDLYWLTDSGEMLVNIRRDGDKIKGFYSGERLESGKPITSWAECGEIDETLAYWLTFVSLKRG